MATGDGHPDAPRRTGWTDVAVRAATTPQEREAAYRLRYEVYIGELGHRQSAADHRRRIIREPLDASALILIACLRDRIVGTVRTSFGGVSDFGSLAALHGMADAGPCYPDGVSLTSQLVIDPGFRNGRVFRALATAAFRAALSAGIAIDFIDCEQRLMPMYAWLGYRATHELPFEHPGLGPRHSMHLWTDRDYLRSVRSPLLRSMH